jgi:hypothetical protein
MIVWQLRTYYNYKEITVDTVQAYRRSYRGLTEEFRHVINEKLKELNSCL